MPRLAATRPAAPTPRSRPGATLALCLCAAALLPGTTGCLLRAQRGEPPLVGEVRIEGNKALAEGDILDKIALTESGRDWLVGEGARNLFDADSLQVDSRRIERFYAANGYFSARVVNVRTAEKKGRVDIVFVVEEGPRSIVRKVEVHETAPLPPEVEARMKENPALKPGDPFSELQLEALKLEMANRLRAAGYAEAELDANAIVNRREASVEVRVDVAPGARYRVSRVFVFGAQQISRSRVQDAAAVPAGALYTPQLVAEAQRRVYELGVFSLVQVEPGPFDRAAAEVPVIVTVTEAPFQTVEAGIGVEADPTRQVGRVRGKYTHRNIARGLQKVIAGGSLGYAFLPSIAAHVFDNSPGERGAVGDASLEYIQPRVRRWPVDAAAGVDYRKEITQAFSYQRAGLRLGLPVRFPSLRALSISPSLNFEQYFAVRPGERGDDATPVTVGGCGTTAGGRDLTSCRLFFGELVLNLDLRDEQISTRNGVFASLSAQLAGTPLSEFSYLRISPELRAFASAGRRVVLAMRARYGVLSKLAGKEPPALARFYAGGATSARTIGAQQLGPRLFVVERNDDYPDDPKAPQFIAGRPIPLGGDRVAEGSVELRWTTGFYGLGLVAFFDAALLGLAANQETGQDSVQETALGPGMGLRYITPFGPLRVDVAYRLNTPSVHPVDEPVLPAAAAGTFPKDPGSYTISPSCPAGSGALCYEEGHWQFFLTLGEAF